MDKFIRMSTMVVLADTATLEWAVLRPTLPPPFYPAFYAFTQKDSSYPLVDGNTPERSK